MTAIALNDLELNTDLDKKAMAAVSGGSHGIGNYSHVHTGRWIRTFYRRFYVNVAVRGRIVRKLQTQKTYVRSQVWHYGRLA